MSDPFIDALHGRLQSTAAMGREDRDAFSDWWDEFVDLLGQKVGAWNERQAPRTPLNFTKQANGAVHLWHRSAEATVTRDGHDVRLSTRLGSEPVRHAWLTLRVAADGGVVATLDAHDLQTPVAAAERVLTPVLMETFARP